METHPGVYPAKKKSKQKQRKLTIYFNIFVVAKKGQRKEKVSLLSHPHLLKVSNLPQRKVSNLYHKSHDLFHLMMITALKKDF